MNITKRVLASIFPILACLVFGGAIAPAHAAGACLHRPAPKGAIGKRIAIVIGNGAYANGIPALPNPTHDAEATSKAIGALGFDIYLATDEDSVGLQKCLDQAYAGLAGTDVAMLYYSGHGIQIQDTNYLVATDAGTNDLKHGFVPVQPIVDALQKQAKATLVLLDACRNNPLAKEAGTQEGLSVSTGRGLARIKDVGSADKVPVVGTPGVVQARGLMVAYATSPNAVAQDGTGKLSPFTGAFVRLVGTSGYSIQRVMSDVNEAVGKETDWGQTPWMKSSLTGELKLGGGETLADAQSVSDNHAARSATLLKNDGKKQAAIVEALKGLPASPDDAALKRFAKAYLALFSAVQSHEIALPISADHAQVAVSTQDRVAVFKQKSDGMSGTLDLWSVHEQKIVATPDAKSLWKFTFSPHGKMLATGGNGGVSVFNGLDGSNLFRVGGTSYATSIEFSPDESRLLIGENSLTIIDVASGKPSTVVKAGQLVSGSGKRRSGTLVQATFSGNDAICFALNTGISKGIVGVYDLKQNKTTHLREAEDTPAVLACDPAGKFMVQTFAVNGSEQGMEIWDLATDKIASIKAPIYNILGIDPKGDYVSVLAFASDAQGMYNLATGKPGHPPTVPDGYQIIGSRVHSASGSLVNQDISINPWRDWPDESLFGPALVKKAMAGLTEAQRAEVARERITYSAVAGNP